MDYAALRRLLESVVVAKGATSHKDLPNWCRNLGMPPPSEEGSVTQRLRSSFSAVADKDLPLLAQRCIDQHRFLESGRYAIQDLMWADDREPAVLKRVRREIARSLGRDIYGEGGASHFDALVASLFKVEGDLTAFDVAFGGPDNSLRAEIAQHVHRNSDWTVEHLFEQLGALDCCNRRFLLLLEGMASPEVRPDEESQRAFVAKVNQELRASGAELRETGGRDGYPTFTVVSLSNTSAGQPKNLIFASQEKPDLRFRDAVNNDIEILSNADKVLVYDRPIGPEGIRWADLQTWWADLKGIPNDDVAKRGLYRRLQEALPANSPPQTLFFLSFFSIHGKRVPQLPALLPEVWLHWDPKTIAQRGVDALTNSRMDFLLLMPGNVRVVIEVDGKHHYTDNEGRPSPAKYGAMVAADRELRFAGYELFRFGTSELDPVNGEACVKAFFESLFKRHGVTV